jgi:hypothetical protein
MDSLFHGGVTVRSNVLFYGKMNWFLTLFFLFHMEYAQMFVWHKLAIYFSWPIYLHLVEKLQEEKNWNLGLLQELLVFFGVFGRMEFWLVIKVSGL